uniref:PD-(D/E)XK nuclease family protein n=2 Tax=Flavobacterium sp. TaxID=239 RepID=UPI0040496A9A
MNGSNILTEKIEIRNSIINYKNDSDVQRLQSLYFSKSFSEILSISRREISHSSFIAWLLDNKENHLLSFFPIQKFLEIIIIRCSIEIEKKHLAFFNSVLTDNYSIKSVIIEKEKSLGKFGRLDIYAEISLLIDDKEQKVKLIIENKVESKENNDQTNTYYQYFEENKKEEEINFYIYLTAIPTLELNQINEPECSCKKFIQINYQDLVDYLLEPALSQNISEKTKFIIKEYLQSLSQPSLDDEITKQKQGLIMALGKEEKELLSNFWKKNEKLIMSAMYAISTDDTQDEEVRETTNKALNALTSSNRDYSTISLYFDENPIFTDFKKSDIGFYTVKLLAEKGLIDENVFAFLREDKSCNFQLLRTKQEVNTETELKKYRVNGKPELIYEGERYYVARNWGKVNGFDNTEKLIEKITEKFPNIKYKRND